ncbi:MAG TPA: hypothetical protein PL110_20550 [Candidatus Eremiobacteraeota bacterium]|nr:MAG: hypothetical protein BWY64_01465 [bacterium ADurb.Bin363]HPZ10492.1 hypothetical protein [Candidatus Eremiobacteraeota bacterium]
MKIGTVTSNQILKQGEIAKSKAESGPSDVIVIGSTEKTPDFLLKKDLVNMKASTSDSVSSLELAVSPLMIIGGIAGLIGGGAAYIYGGPVGAAIMGGLGGAMVGLSLGHVLCEKANLNDKQTLVNTGASVITGAALGVLAGVSSEPVCNLIALVFGAGSGSALGAVGGFILNEAIGV